eukprot:NP_001337276.1 Uncharacterized protein CELE_T25D1.1 [Caenorhabditis elegans]
MLPPTSPMQSMTTPKRPSPAVQRQNSSPYQRPPSKPARKSVKNEGSQPSRPERRQTQANRSSQNSTITEQANQFRYENRAATSERPPSPQFSNQHHDATNAMPIVYQETQLHATKGGKWSPIGFAATQLFDCQRGVPFDRDTCELALGLAFVAGKGNRNQEPKPENLEETVAKTTIPNIGFSVDTAKKCDANLVLPSQRYFKISEALKPGEIGGATSSKFVSHTRKLARKMFDKIDKVNDLMICYAATSSSTSKKYNVINDQFFIKLADFFIHGFGQKPTGDRREFVKNLLVEVMHNKLNRIRNRYNQEKGANKSEEAGKWMQMELKKENCGELVRTRLQLPSASNDVWDDEDVENDAFETPVREEYRREKENEHPRSVEPEEPDDMMD